MQVAKGIDDAQLSSTVNATMAHQMNLAKVKLGTKSVTDTWVYPIDDDHTWNYNPGPHDITASSNFSGNVPYLHSDTYYYYVFKPVATNADSGTTLTAFKPNSTTATDWSWEMNSVERGKMLSHTAVSSSTAQNIMHENELSIAQIAALTADDGKALTIPISVLLNSAELTKGTDYTVTFKNSSNATVTSISAAGDYTAIFTPTGRYSGDAVSRAFKVNRDGKTITFGSTTQINKTYGDAAFTQAVTKTGTGTVTYSSSDTNLATVNSSTGQVTIKAAGTAVITATVADSDYDHYATNTASYTLTVGKKAVTVTASAQTVTYGTAITQGTAKVAASGLVSGHSVSAVTLAQSTTNATNSGTITPSDAVIKDGSNNVVTSNYNITYATGVLTINKKAVTITAKAQTVTYGTGITTGTGQVTASGLLSGHSVSAVTLTQSTTNATSSGTITPSAAAIKDGNNTVVTSNYSITYATGALTINRKALSSTELKFASAAITKDYVWQIPSVSNALTKPSNCTVTYSSSNTGVASVNSSTGALTPGGTTGTNATITATATGNYSGTATYTIRATSKVVNFAYTGSPQSVTLPKGSYTFECWGAQGAADASLSYAGFGGYAKGNLAITASTTFYAYVGGAGSGYTGGWNGGGNGKSHNQTGYAGGGATDFRLTYNSNFKDVPSLKSRIIVAGGGGGAAGNSGGGGGLSGTDGWDLARPTEWAGLYSATGGKQTAPGYPGNSAGQNGDYSSMTENSTLYNCHGYFGYGGSSTYDFSGGGGGGGGWYGGGASIRGHGGAGGGSGFIAGHSGCKAPTSMTGTTVSHRNDASHPSGKNFTSTQMISGNRSSSMPAPGGGTEVGHHGNGYARITWIGN